jgi:CDP-diacylglycerol--glycerol-3-phosphate 3-phosphatidyltransferase
MTTLYRLKPRFQAMLRPLVQLLAAHGVTANGVTVTAMLLSVALGVVLFTLGGGHAALFLLLPMWMVLRMAMNAIDGMLAREFGQQSALGAYLNELSDVVADAALALPFALIAPFGWASVGCLIFLAALSEMAGALGPMIGAPRQYNGPMGKSDRAFLFGALGLWLGTAGSLPDLAFWLLPIAYIAIIVNIRNRIYSGIRAADKP